MNSFFVATLAIVLAAVNAGIIADHDLVLQGPSSKTTLVGPDGSHISGYAPGGKIVHSIDVGYAAHTGHVHAAPLLAPVVAHAAPIVAHVAPAVAHSAAIVSHVAHAAPIVAHAAPFVAHAAPIVAHVAPIVAHAAPVVAHVGPAVAHSSFSRVDHIASTGVVSHAAPVVVAHAHVGHNLSGLGHGLAGLGHGFGGLGHDLTGSGHEGQYEHDYTETLYDDGSYKPEIYNEHHHEHEHHY